MFVAVKLSKYIWIQFLGNISHNIISFPLLVCSIINNTHSPLPFPFSSVHFVYFFLQRLSRPLLVVVPVNSQKQNYSFYDSRTTQPDNCKKLICTYYTAERFIENYYIIIFLINQILRNTKVKLKKKNYISTSFSHTSTFN